LQQVVILQQRLWRGVEEHEEELLMTRLNAEERY
jgi:hypothetical protein